MILALALLLQSAVQPSDWVELNQVRGHFGGCPWYKVRVYADGRVLWHGVQFVEVPGDAEARISAPDVQVLIEEYRTKGFWELKPDYPHLKTDHASTYTTVHIGEDEKSVADHDSAPEWLKAMNRRLNELADTHRWWHGDARTERFAKRSHALDNIQEDAYLPKPGVTALMKAAGAGRLEDVEALLGSGADVNARDPSGWTALMYAVGDLNLEQGVRKVSALLRAGADPRARSDAGADGADGS